MKNKVRAWLLTAGLLACASLQGCRDNGGEPPHQEVEEAVTLKVCISNINTNKETLEKLGERYQQEHPEIGQIKWDVVSSDAYYNLLRMNLASGKLPDIIMVNGTNELEEWNGHLIPLEEAGAVSGIDQRLSEGSRWNSLYYSVPIMCEEVGILYNMELLNSVGWEEIPETFSELKALCEDLEEQQIKPFINSYTNTSRMIESGLMQMISMKAFPELYMTLLEHDNQSDIARDKNWNQLMDFYDLTLAYGNRRPLEISTELARNYFNIDKYAMIVNESPDSLGQAGGAGEQPRDIRLGPLLLSDNPEENKLQVRVIRMGVTKYCANPEAAAAFLEWLAGDEEENEMSRVRTEKLSRWQDERTTIDITRTIPDVMVEKMVPIWAKYVSGEISREVFLDEVSASLQDYATKYKRR